MEKVKSKLELPANEILKTMAYAVVKDDAHHKHIMGKNGSTPNKFKTEADVTNNTPETKSGITVGRIEGSKELHGMVDKLEDEKEKDMILKNRFHGQLLGSKGENIEKVLANVEVSIPDLGVKSNIVTG